MDIKDMVSGGKKATFLFYQQNELWYMTECGFKFPVPIEDIGEAIVHSTEKAMLLMRYIRKHIALIEAAKAKHIEEFGDSLPFLGNV